ncbi:MAG: rRNA maturation RNase YbeY [Cyanobacteriota bacterium]|nr:rRNA maturation RNase YbeY [Cyanobacteriota bacterium]
MTQAPIPRLELAAAGSLESASEAHQRAWHQHLSAWLRDLRPGLPPTLRSPAYTLGLTLCDDAEISQLNHQWRGQEGPTDVLAFAIQEAPLPLPPADLAVGEDGAAGEPLELGDIVISLETARRQATAEGHSLSQELLFLASHGLLHLLGWDHPDELSLAAMLERQDALLAATAALPDVTSDPCAGERTG